MGAEPSSVRRRLLALSLVVAACSAGWLFAPTSKAVLHFDDASSNWVGAWAAAPTNANYPPASSQSFRMIVRPAIGGEAVRLRFSNAYGELPLNLASVVIAKRTEGAAVDAATTTRVTFGGRADTSIAPGGVSVSDTVRFRYRYGEDLAITFFVENQVTQVTGHGLVTGLVTSFTSPPESGDATDDTTGEAFTQSTTLTYFLAGLDAYVPGALGTVVAFGDSITDGSYSTLDGHDSYPELLAARLQREGLKVGVVSQGIPGNTLLPCPTELAAGDAGVDRFDRDVLTVPNVRVVIIKEGGNDLRGCPVTAPDVQRGLQNLADRSRGAGIASVLGTYVPRVSRTVVAATDAVPDEAGDDQRQALNTWLRERSGTFDGFIDFDAVIRDPQDPNRQRAEFDSGDGVHPNARGYRAMAESIPLDLLRRLLAHR